MEDRRSRWLPQVWTGDDFADFRPYVPAVDDTGSVVFQAALTRGGSGVFLCREKTIEVLLPAQSGVDVVSHPDRNARGDSCVYVSRADGSGAIVGMHRGLKIAYVDTRDGFFSAIGPLGPVIDTAGNVGFRAVLADGSAAVCAWCAGEIRVLASTARDFSAFHGLPVIADEAGLLFRADRRDGTQGIYRAVDGDVRAVLDRAEGDLALFPTMNASGEIACGWMDPAGEAHLLRIAADGAVRRVDTGDLRFRSLRGCLLGEGDGLCFTGAPQRGTLGVYRVRRGGVDCLLAEGDLFDGVRIAGFALNPVSVNAQGMLVARILLEDGRQAIAVCP